MLERDIERYFKKTVEKLGGESYKFVSPARPGVSDRIACLPNGSVWFVEIKSEDGRLSGLQKLFAEKMKRLNQKYACLWSKEDVDQWALTISDKKPL